MGAGGLFEVEDITERRTEDTLRGCAGAEHYLSSSHIASAFRAWLALNWSALRPSCAKTPPPNAR
jgi:hypothetical protein